MTVDDRPDARRDLYLWDPRAEPAAEIETIERRLAPARYDASRRPLPPVPAIPVRRTGPAARRRWWAPLAATAAALLVLGALAAWRWTWPAGRAWPVEAAPPGVPDRFRAGGTLAVAESETAVVRVARIGTMRLEGGTVVTLLATGGNRHRLALEKGSVRVRVWGPPSSVAFRTPAGEVIDLGCEFDLSVEDRASRVRVLSGWVQLANGLGESLVPAGGIGEMRRDASPSVPVFEDAAPGFLGAVRALEEGAGPVEDAVREVVARARPRDVLTLLMLVRKGVPGSDRIAARAADLWPPPAGVTVAGVLQGDDQALWRWRDTLPLPPPKEWWRNWRDALPGRPGDRR